VSPADFEFYLFDKVSISSKCHGSGISLRRRLFPTNTAACV
jgi:hypothetical protein